MIAEAEAARTLASAQSADRRESVLQTVAVGVPCAEEVKMYARLTEPLRVLRLERARKANRAIDALGLNRTELAAVLGVCRQRLAFVLRGRNGLPAENEGLSGRPPQVTAQGLARALGLRADAFMEKTK